MQGEVAGNFTRSIAGFLNAGGNEGRLSELVGIEQFKPAGYIPDAANIKKLSAFFYWGSWFCAAQRPASRLQQPPGTGGRRTENPGPAVLRRSCRRQHRSAAAAPALARHRRRADVRPPIATRSGSTIGIAARVAVVLPTALISSGVARA